MSATITTTTGVICSPPGRRRGPSSRPFTPATQVGRRVPSIHASRHPPSPRKPPSWPPSAASLSSSRGWTAAASRRKLPASKSGCATRAMRCAGKSFLVSGGVVPAHRACQGQRRRPRQDDGDRSDDRCVPPIQGRDGRPRDTPLVQCESVGVCVSRALWVACQRGADADAGAVGG